MESNNGASLFSLFDSSTVYENSSGDLKVYFPEKMKRGEGITLEKGEETMELIPSAGNFKYSSVSNNAIRYCDVFENVDVQYTMLGNMVKEDIILLEKTDRNEFSYRLKIPGLKAAEADNSIIIYKSQKTDPLFVINAPIMIDAAGETSTDITLKLVKEDIKGHRTTYVYDKEFSLLQVISASGKTMDITMDDEFRITQVIQPDGGTWTYEYDSAGDLVTVTNPAGSERHYEYDDSHGMTAWYDENGNCITKNTYDDQHRVTVQEDANGNTATLEYSDDHTTMTDNNGNVTTIYFDDLGRTLKVVNPDGSTEVSTYNSSGHLGTKKDVLGTTTSYVYDTNGNILTETRGDGSIRSFTYDERNQLLTATDYMGNVSRFSYDEAGNLITRSDGNGNTTMYSYDSLNRPESITDPNSNITRFAYEGNDCVPTSMTDGEGNTSTFSYDEMNRIHTSTDAEGNTTSHVYDANGWEISTIAPDGGVIQYDFSPAGEVVSITDAMDAKTDFTYDKMHNILSGTVPWVILLLTHMMGTTTVSVKQMQKEM